MRKIFTAEDHSDMRELADSVARATTGLDVALDRLLSKSGVRDTERPLYPPRTSDWR